jgi:hypothetical protein
MIVMVQGNPSGMVRRSGQVVSRGAVATTPVAIYYADGTSDNVQIQAAYDKAKA